MLHFEFGSMIKVNDCRPDNSFYFLMPHQYTLASYRIIIEKIKFSNSHMEKITRVFKVYPDFFTDKIRNNQLFGLQLS